MAAGQRRDGADRRDTVYPVPFLLGAACPVKKAEGGEVRITHRCCIIRASRDSAGALSFSPLKSRFGVGRLDSLDKNLVKHRSGFLVNHDSVLLELSKGVLSSTLST